MPLDAETRAMIRAKIDELARIAVEVDNIALETCSGCAMPRSDWTPGCQQCWDRHRNWRIGRNRCPYRLGDLNALARQIGALIEQHKIMRARETLERYNGPRRTNAYV